MRVSTILTAVVCSALLVASNTAAEPKMIAYSARPNAYFNHEAHRVAPLYDGFFFTIGTWDEGVTRDIGLGPDASAQTDWREQVRENLEHLREAGVTENLLGVCFGGSGTWPSPDTLLSDEYTDKMARHFGALGQAAADLGFRGVSIDVEYPYPRYELDHEIYTYDGYTAEDLLQAAARQGRATMSALLDGFPEAVVFVLPGVLWDRPLARAYQLAMLKVMAERDAPGGLHVGTERTYTLLDPVAQAGIPRAADLNLRVISSDKTVLEYWRRRCTMAPGVWPLHMVETGGKDYPVRPWPEELAELREQMATLRATAKRYIWSYSGKPVWYRHTPQIEAQYGLTKQEFDGVDEAIPGWHAILAESTPVTDPRVQRLIKTVHAFDRGKLSPADVCHRFGTPGEWLLLGPLSNPLESPAFAAADAFKGPYHQNHIVHGRDGAVRWFPYRPYDPTGIVLLRDPFDWFNTHHASVHLVSVVESKREVDAYLWLSWDDGAVFRLNDDVVFDHPTYPPRGHGMGYRDRYLFETKVPVHIPKGESRLSVTSINQKGNWGFHVRLADEDGFPLEGISFHLPVDAER